MPGPLGPFIVFDPNRLVTPSVVGLPGQTVYLPIDINDVQILSMQSRRATGGACSNVSTTPIGEALLVEPIVDLDALFTAPFRVEP